MNQFETSSFHKPIQKKDLSLLDWKQVLSRRMSLPGCMLLFTRATFADPKLGDPEWMRRFRTFIKAFNEFVEALDDNRLDRAKWARMRHAWNDIDVG